MAAGKKLTNEDFLKRIESENIKYIPLENYKNMNTKIKWLCYKDKTHIFEMRPRAIFDGQNCPYCIGKKVIVGYNDFATTHPELSKNLKDINNAYLYSYGSHKVVDWICPNCGNVIRKSFHEVSSLGLCCKICSDGISYPEKFVISLLNQLNVKFIHDNCLSWSNKKRYDFYLEEYDMVIECHGGLHYKDTKFSNYIDIRNNDYHKRKLAFDNGIKNYIELDCKISNKEYIKTSILNSDLSNIFNLLLVNWDRCDMYGQSSLFNEVLNLWNSGINNTVEISDILNIDRHIPTKYLKIAANNNLCNYNPMEETEKARKKACMLRSKKVICIETLKVFDSIAEATKSGDFVHQGISACCRHEQKTHRNLHWMFYDEYLLSNKGVVI